MKSGFLSSVGLHALALAIAFISFNAVPKPLENSMTEALPITLVPISDKASIREGDKTSPLSEKPAPKPTTKPAVKPAAENVGDGEVDVVTPLKPKEKPRDVNASQPTAGKPDAAPDIVPPQEKPIESKPDSGAMDATQVTAKAEPPTPQIIENQNKPNTVKPEPAKPVEPKPIEPKPVEPKPEPVKPQVTKPEPQPQEIPTQVATQDALQPKPQEAKPMEQEPKPVEPQPTVSKPVEAVKPQETTQVEPVPQLPTNNAPIPGARPQATAKTTERVPTDTPKPSTSSAAGEDVADIINNNPQTAMVDRTRTQGGGAKRSEGEAGFGGSQNIGDQPTLAQTVGSIIQGCMSNAWRPPISAAGGSQELMVKAVFELGPNGDIIGEPQLTPIGGDPNAQRIMATTGLAALKRCSPFKGLPAESYAQWRLIALNLYPSKQ